MGYGKTTAINWYLTDRSQNEKINIVRISVYSDNTTILWKSVQDAFLYAGYDFLQNYPYPTDQAGASLLADMVCHELEGDLPCFVFIDDFHLMTDRRVSEFICILVGRLPENVHMIIASRDRFLPSAEILRLGNKVCQIGAGNLRLNHTELTIYAHRCGADLTEKQADELLYSSEGWFSVIYLNLRTLAEQGKLPDGNSDIYTMFTAAMIDPLSDDQREFLAVMGLADEFIVEMASYITGHPDAANLIQSMTEQNAFVTRLPDGEHFRFHHMMKECAERTFRTLSTDKQVFYRNRYGQWYREHEQYIHAFEAFILSGNFDLLLEVIQDDAGILLSTMSPDEVLETLDGCPKDVLLSHPLAILVLMRCMFNWHRIPKMMEMKAMLLEALERNPDMDEAERGNLLGECDLITSFLMYNDISAMSALHRSASERMSRPAISLSNKGGWSFGSPSVLMMYYRQGGELARYLLEMDECMPHYYKITDGHGKGAEKITRAEACLMQGDFADAQIRLEEAYNMAEPAGQENMVLCADFAAVRLSLFADIELRCSLEHRYKEILKSRNIQLINIWNAISAYYYSVLGQNDKIPEVFRSHMLSSVKLLMPGKPMNEMIQNQVYLLQKVPARIIARNDELLGMCKGMHYALVAIHLLIQNAAAYEMIGKRDEAVNMLRMALADAKEDELALPFAENYRYIRPLLESITSNEDAQFIGKIHLLGQQLDKRLNSNSKGNERPAALEVLTDREYEIAVLLNDRLSGREIAEKLFLSEGSVKQYVNQIYSKLRIEGDRKGKRQQLYELFINKK